MTTLRETLAAQLARYDDDAFAALANRGLLRRAAKDLDKMPATVAEDGDAALVMAFGEHRIRFDARGPAHAQCSCPASGVCQHILAAAIALQRLAASPCDAADKGGDAAAPDVLADLHAALAAIPDAELQRHAGKPGYRWAWQFVQDLDPERGLAVGGELHLVLAFAHPRLALRYMGGGLDALVADVDLPQPARYRVAALLAYRRLRGLPVAPPEGAARADTAALDLGHDHELAAAGGDTADSRARLRAAARQLVAECIGVGLSHLSRGIHERFATLAVWSQGADYPRLSLLLRRAADHVELLLARAGGADEHVLFDELTLAAGLLRALDDAAARGAAPAPLVGRSRARYAGVGALELIGLGANAWRSGAGFVGLTMLFWSPADQAFMSCTEARPETMRGFDPLVRYRAAGPWSGLAAPQQATGRRLRLGGAQLSHQGRLSGAESTTALVLLPEPASALRAALPAVTDWAELAAAQGDARRGLLREARPMEDWVVLEPARFGVAIFDSARQVLTWPLHDAQGRVLRAELAWSRLTQHALARIEGLATPAPGTRLVARLQPARRTAPEAGADDAETGLVVEPTSLVRVDAAPGASVIDALFFDDAADAADAPSVAVPARGAPPQAAEPTPSAPLVRLPRLLAELRRWLQQQAERGVGEGRQAAVALALADWGRRCADAGFTAFAAPADTRAPAPALLRANYLCLQLERLVGGDASDDD